MTELIASPYQITLLKDSSYQTEFETAEDGPMKKAWNTKFSNKDLSLQIDPKKMMTYVMSGDYVMYDSYSTIRASQEFQDCKITDIGFSLSKVEFAFALPKNSPFQKPFNSALRKMEESGELMRIRKHTSEDNQDCEENTHGNPIGIENVIFPVIVYMIGLSLAMVLLVMETLANRSFIFTNIQSKFLDRFSYKKLSFIWANILAMSMILCILVINNFY